LLGSGCGPWLAHCYRSVPTEALEWHLAAAASRFFKWIAAHDINDGLQYIVPSPDPVNDGSFSVQCQRGWNDKRCGATSSKYSALHILTKELLALKLKELIIMAFSALTLIIIAAL